MKKFYEQDLDEQLSDCFQILERMKSKCDGKSFGSMLLETRENFKKNKIRPLIENYSLNESMYDQIARIIDERFDNFSKTPGY